MKILQKLLIAASVFAMSACGGGGGNSSTGGVYFTHQELANEFVRRVNIDLYGYDLQLMKTNTLQYDYIVVYDWSTGTYDAYWLGNYNPGENLYSYMTSYDAYFYYDLIPESGNTYRDYWSGTLFQVQEGNSKNLAAMKALNQKLVIDQAADSLQANYGMSEESAQVAASFAYKLKTAPKGTYNTKDYDAFAKEFIGSSITEIQSDVQSGNITSLNERLEIAGKQTGMGSEGVKNLIKEVL